MVGAGCAVALLKEKKENGVMAKEPRECKCKSCAFKIQP
jgi:hypothetical protein